MNALPLGDDRLVDNRPVRLNNRRMRYANAKGLALAGGVLLIEIAVVAFGLSLDGHTDPTALTTAPDALAPLTLPVDPQTVVRHDRPGDAVGLIRAAIDDYLVDPGRFEAFIDDPEPAGIARLPALQQLLDATLLADNRGVLADRIDQVIVYGESPAVAALERIGQAAIKAGEVLQRSDPDRAWRYFEAAFSLGSRAFAERLTYRELNAGVTLMSTAGAWLGTLAERTGKAGEAVRVARFRDGLTAFAKSRLSPTIEAIYSFNDALIDRHAGDVFTFASRSDERVWRIESILKLGRLKYNAGRLGDQHHARRVLDALDASDPATRRAADLARGLTVEQFRMLR